MTEVTPPSQLLQWTICGGWLAEIRDQIEQLLLLDDLFNAVAYPVETPDARSLDLRWLFWLWELACEHGMRQLLAKVEDVLSEGTGLRKQLNAFGDGDVDHLLVGLSPQGLHLAASSLLKILKRSRARMGCAA